ncbi:MAG: methyltransferase domain-containing protein [Caulobacteraceae bacterium]
MRRDVLEMRAFYGAPLGAAVRDLICRKLVEAWGDAHGLDVLGLGYATPFLEPFYDRARRVVASMPQGQGVEVWPGRTANLACLSPETSLPFPNALFDRVLVIHGLEESEDPTAMLAEVQRVLNPSGRVIAAVTCRRGWWAGSEATPFGYGRPFSRRQLEEAVRDAGLEPAAWSRALYLPPHRWMAPHAELIEQLGSRLLAPMSGIILLEAVKQTFAVKPRGSRAPAALQPRLAPQPAAMTRQNLVCAAEIRHTPATTASPGDRSIA